MDISELSLADSEEKMDVDTDLTNKFLSGEMSFSQYSSEWYSGEEDEDEDDIEESRKCEEEAEMSPTVSKRGLKRQSKFRRTLPCIIWSYG
ncbi:unnamed protein product [Danaus chrysippus]|uniref:(African queen) hypothetical protein n=1 Tax=Danaus chrysippus TaxID=151541 RepID=A0A8J2R9W1_9NEOP|nr:unnamed protein product [Danaus chrysippus]